MLTRLVQMIREEENPLSLGGILREDEYKPYNKVLSLSRDELPCGEFAYSEGASLLVSLVLNCTK